MNTTLITGNTYPVKDAIKALGGSWDSNRQGWLVPVEKAEEARKLVDSTPQRQRIAGGWRGSKHGSNYTRFASGHEVYNNRRGRCEDAPCCGCCS